MNENLKFGLAFAAVAILIVSSGILIYAAVTQYATIHTTGVVVSYGLETDPTEFDWGTVEKGTPTTQSVTLSNTGTEPITSLSQAVDESSLVGLALSDFTLTWDITTEGIPSGESLTVTFTFIATQTTPSFNFDIIVSGT